MVEGDGIALVLYRIPPGTQFPTHDHPFAELGVVLSGRGRSHLAGQLRVLRAGDAFYIPPGVSHDFTADGPDPVVMLNTTVPLHSDVVGPSADSLESLARPAPPVRVSGASAR